MDAAADERVREPSRSCHVTRVDARVQRDELREWMELEAAPGEVAVDDAVGVVDVRLAAGGE